MNERIRQLAEQAFDKANNGAISDIKIPKEFIEKFAEMIVRECMDIVQKNDGYRPYRPGKVIVSEIKRHFGVEE